MESTTCKLNPKHFWKVKVFLLNNTGNWDEFGTGKMIFYPEMGEIDETPIPPLPDSDPPPKPRRKPHLLV